MKPVFVGTKSQIAADSMEARQITAQEADSLLQDWERFSSRVCFAVCMGELAWHAHWVGTLRTAGPGRWMLATEQTTNTVSINEYKEIILAEDDELVGLRFRQPGGGDPGFEVDLFIDKHDGLDQDTLPLISKIVQ
jgi:hypothetical protein